MARGDHLPIPKSFATCRCGTPSATSLLINAQSSKVITHPIVWVASFSSVAMASFSNVADNSTLGNVPPEEYEAAYYDETKAPSTGEAANKTAA
jgi:hypothetical protein